jgi:uncharacterized protein with ParB-like and HNH nuclease domain
MIDPEELESGTDVDLDVIEVEDEAATDETPSAVQYVISSYGADYDVEGLVKRLNRGDIIIPSFQRNYVWKQGEASRFIESLLLGLPVPGIFLEKELETNKLLVIDGQQRLKTLQFFYEGYFNPKDDAARKTVFKLIGVQRSFEGNTYLSLEEKDRIKLNDSLIHATIVRQEAPEGDSTSIYHIFDRLNSTGRKLTPQEIRTAVCHGSLIDLLRTLNDNTNWREIFGKPNDRLKDQELILRFFAFFYESDRYEKPMNEFLTKFATRNRNPEQRFISEAHNIFESTIELVKRKIGSRAFRLTNAINAAVFDSVMVGIASNVERLKELGSDEVRLKYEGLLQSKDFREIVSQSTSDEANVKRRLELAQVAFGMS